MSCAEGRGRSMFACYEDGRCAAVGTASEVADAMGVGEATVRTCATPSRHARRVGKKLRGTREYYRFGDWGDDEQ